MSVITTTHLNFHGQAQEALTFYQSVFGGQLTIATYGDFGMPANLPGAANVVFGQVVSESGFQIMAYDVPGADAAVSSAISTHRENGTTITKEPFFVSLRGESTAEVEALWLQLGDGGTVIEAFAPSQWSPGFGMLADRFGVTWIFDGSRSMGRFITLALRGRSAHIKILSRG